MKEVISTLEDWCSSCDEMINCLEKNAENANKTKENNLENKAAIEKKVKNCVY